MRVDMFCHDDVAGFELQPVQLAPFESDEAWHAVARHLAAGGDAFTLRGLDGRRVAIVGLYPVYPHYALGWAFLAHGLGAAMVPVTRIVRRYIDDKMKVLDRIEVSVAFEHKQAHWWASKLGFRYEGTRAKAGPDGGDLVSYVRIAERRS